MKRFNYLSSLRDQGPKRIPTLKISALYLYTFAMVFINPALADDALSKTDLMEGKRTFSIHCAQCHGIGGVGGGHSRNGPSLTDKVTIYGDELEDIYKVISEGIPRAAMPQWKQKMPDARIRELAAYVFSIKGTKKKRKTSTTEGDVTQQTGTADGIKEGKKKFHLHCAQCHGISGTGGVGPNLADHESIHGDSFRDIVAIITNGAPNKLMPAWGEKFSSQTVNQLAAYVCRIKATQVTQRSFTPTYPGTHC